MFMEEGLDKEQRTKGAMRPRSDAANDHVTFGCEYLASGFRYCVHFPVLPSTLTFPLSHFYFFNDNDFSPPPENFHTPPAYLLDVSSPWRPPQTPKNLAESRSEGDGLGLRFTTLALVVLVVGSVIQISGWATSTKRLDSKFCAFPALKTKETEVFAPLLLSSPAPRAITLYLASRTTLDFRLLSPLREYPQPA
jgi:hypothetical protein